MKAEDIFECGDIDCIGNGNGLYIEVDPDRSLYSEITKYDAIRLAKFFNLTIQDLDT